jgi:ribonuclease BN (tRNA processing enzyme)
MVYASDVGYPEGEIPSEILDHYAGANVLIHDCTYSPEDQGERRNRGFSSIEDAARAAAEAEVEHLVMFHYDQDYSDTRVDDLTRRLRALLDDLGGKEIRLTAAAEGLTIDV